MVLFVHLFTLKPNNITMKKIGSHLFIFAFVGVLSSFKAGNHGNIITFDNGVNYFWKADNCIAPYIPALSQRDMKSSKGFYMVDVTFQLPEGHCDIPARGTTVTRYEGQDQWAVIHHDGLVKGKILVRPN
jgi:hypothetical protein